MNELDEFDNAVLCMYDANSAGDTKVRAIQYCNQVKTASDGWLFCLEKFFKANKLEVKFFCLLTLQELVEHGRYNSLSVPEKELLKASLMRWLTEFLLSNGQSEDIAIKNKFAQVLVLVFKIDYPQDWTTFFVQLLSLVPRGPVMVDMFLRIMKTIDDEIISNELSRNNTNVAISNRIKDSMRERCINSIVSAWFEILTTYQSTMKEICRDCLENIKRYIGWIDSGLIANDKFVPLFFNFLSIDSYREKSCECLLEIVSKGISDPLTKYTLLKKLNLIPVLANISLNDEEEFLEKVGELVNAIGCELLQCMKEIQILTESRKASKETLDDVRLLLDSALDLSFKYLNHEDDSISETVLKFSYGYLHSLKGLAQLTEKQTSQISLFLRIIRNKIKFTAQLGDYNKREDRQDDTVLFLDYRKELCGLFKVLVQLCPQMVATFVHESITTVIENLRCAAFYDVEVALTLFFIIGDGISEQAMKSIESFFEKTLLLIISSGISMYSSEAVIIVYFDIIVRYSRFLPSNNPELLKEILIAFFDTRGIRNSHATVRSRACYLLLRFLKSRQSEFIPFISGIFQVLKEFLDISYELEKAITFEDQIHLYDALGFLIGQIPLSEQHQQLQYVDAVLSPLIVQMQLFLEKRLYSNDLSEKPLVRTLIIQMISAIGTFSKGFTGQKEVRVYFKQVLSSVLQFRQDALLAQHEDFRSKITFYLHRMIECLHSEILEFVPTIISQHLELGSNRKSRINDNSSKAFSRTATDSDDDRTNAPEIPNSTESKDYLEFIRLLNQLTSKFKEQMFPILNPLLMSLIERFYQIASDLMQLQQQQQPSVVAATNEIEREILELKRNYYLFLSTLIGNSLATIFTSQENISHLRDILKTVIQGCQELRDLNGAKLCYGVLKRMIEQWSNSEIGIVQACSNDGNHTSSLVEGFSEFVFENVIPMLLKEPFRTDFDLNDAGVTAVLYACKRITEEKLY